MHKHQYFDSGFGSGIKADSILTPAVMYKVRLAVPMALYVLFYCVSFLLIENWNRLRYTVIHTAVDDAVPFCEWFVIPYLLWFAYVCGFTFYMFLHDEERYHEIGTFLAIGMTVFLAVSVCFPNILYLRPDTMPRNNILTYLCERLYAVDTPTNVTPSIHVYNSIAVMITVWYTKAGIFRHLWSKITITVQGLSIILATMFIKQHSFSDVVIATGLALFSYILVFKLGFVAVGKKRRKEVRRSVFEH